MYAFVGSATLGPELRKSNSMNLYEQKNRCLIMGKVLEFPDIQHSTNLVFDQKIANCQQIQRQIRK